MEKRIVKLYAKNNTVPLKVVPGHFATNHSHVNYYIDMTTLKTRLSEAGSVAASLAGLYMTNTIVDTIVCLDGTQVIGTLLAQGTYTRRISLHERSRHYLRGHAGIQLQ